MPNTVPNQKIITIKKEPCDTRNLYAKINLEAMKRAMSTLTNATFEVWLYFAKNQENYTFASSPKAAEEWGIARSSYDRAIKKFITEGYLIADREGSNHYTFYEIPKEKGTFTPYYGPSKEEEKGHDWSF